MVGVQETIRRRRRRSVIAAGGKTQIQDDAFDLRFIGPGKPFIRRAQFFGEVAFDPADAQIGIGLIVKGNLAQGVGSGRNCRAVGFLQHRLPRKLFEQAVDSGAVQVRLAHPVEIGE